MNLCEAEKGTYEIKELNTDDAEVETFLFRLGCYPGEKITLLSKKRNNCVIVIKDGRYALDSVLAESIIVL